MATEKQRLTFISYSRADKDFALELAQELRSSGFSIWLDQLDIPTGSRWDDEVEKALLECEIFMVIMTPDSIASNNVKDEIGYAIDSNKRIMPVLLENAILPFRLRRFQYVDFTRKSHEEGIEAAKQLLRKLLSEPTSPVSPIPSVARKQEAAPLPVDSEIRPSSTESIELERAKAIQRAKDRERLERQARTLRPVPASSSKIPDHQAQGKPYAKFLPVSIGAGLFVIVFLVAGLAIWPYLPFNSQDITPIPPTTVSPPSGPTLSSTPAPPTSTSTPTATVKATFTSTITETSVVALVAPRDPREFIEFYFDTVIKGNTVIAGYPDHFQFAWYELLTDDFKSVNNSDGFDPWRNMWASYDTWSHSPFSVESRKGETQAIVSGNFAFGAGKPTYKTYCLARVESQYTWWRIDHGQNCTE